MLPTRNTAAEAASDTPIMQYSSGHITCRTDKTRFGKGWTGFYVEIGKWPAFDDALTHAGFETLEVQHTREGKPGEIKQHWNFGENLLLFPLTAGPVAKTVQASLSPRYVQATREAGLACVWPHEGKSRLAVRGYVIIGDEAWLVTLATKATMTQHLLHALLDHVRVATIADELSNRKDNPVALVEVGLPLVAAQQAIAAGSTQTAEVYPLVSAHPAQIDAAYLKTLWRPKAIIMMAEQDWPGVQEWAMSFGQEREGV